MKKISVNQFNKGLNLDNNPVSVSNDSLIGALNATFITKNGNEVVLQNDVGNASVDKAQLPAGYVPLGAKEHGGIIYVASYNPLTDESQIGCFPSPQRNFATTSNDNIKDIGSLCSYVGERYRDNDFVHFYSNRIYEQKIINIPGSEDNIIRPGDKFIITSDDCGDLNSDSNHEKIRLRVLVITSDNQSIDITDELTEPNGHFGHVPFVKDIANYPTILDTDYTIYTNRTCGQLCLRAELIFPDYFELSYNSSYDANSDTTTLTVDFISYKDGKIMNWNSGYFGTLKIGNDYYESTGGSNNQKIYTLTGIPDDAILEFTYYPIINVECGGNNYHLLINQMRKSEEIEFSLIGSGRVTFNTFRYFNDFDNNHLVFNYGIRFYQRNSQYELTDLYLELINLRDLDAVSWNYSNTNLNKKRIALNTSNTHGIYTETIDYLTTQQTNISLSNSIIPIDELLAGGENKILVGQYYLARICAWVNGTTLYKGDWHALLTSEATNYIYNNGEQDMLNLQKENAIDYIEHPELHINDSDPNNKILLNYTLNDSNEVIDNYEEKITQGIGYYDNYFSITLPNTNELRFEIEKSSQAVFRHNATSSLIIPKLFPFLESEISYTPTVIADIQKNIDDPDHPYAFVQYQDNIEVRRGNDYTSSGTIKHYDTQILKDNQKIGGNGSIEAGGKNEIRFQSSPSSGINININYKLYSQLFTPFEKNLNNQFIQRTYNDSCTMFVPYVSNNNDLIELLNQSSVSTGSNNRIYPEKMLYCIYERSTLFDRSSVGLIDYITNESTITDPRDITNSNNGETLLNRVRGSRIYPTDPTISKYLQTYNPNIAVFSSCINTNDDSIFESADVLVGQTFNTYDMLLIKGDDDEMYLLGDIETTKGDLLKKFK